MSIQTTLTTQQRTTQPKISTFSTKTPRSQVLGARSSYQLPTPNKWKVPGQIVWTMIYMIFMIDMMGLGQQKTSTPQQLVTNY